MSVLSKHGYGVSGPKTGRLLHGYGVLGPKTGRLLHGYRVSGSKTGRLLHGYGVSGSKTCRLLHGYGVLGSKTCRLLHGYGVSGLKTCRLLHGYGVRGPKRAAFFTVPACAVQNATRFLPFRPARRKRRAVFHSSCLRGENGGGASRRRKVYPAVRSHVTTRGRASNIRGAALGESWKTMREPLRA